MKSKSDLQYMPRWKKGNGKCWKKLIKIKLRLQTKVRADRQGLLWVSPKEMSDPKSRRTQTSFEQLKTCRYEVHQRDEESSRYCHGHHYCSLWPDPHVKIIQNSVWGWPWPSKSVFARLSITDHAATFTGCSSTMKMWYPKWREAQDNSSPNEGPQL